MAVDLHGYKYSVYAWIARLTLREKGVNWRWHEIDPFAPDLPAAYLDLHPFGRVPVLVHDGATIYETAAITQYIDEAFDGPVLQPTAPLARARMRQVIGVVDSYAYWPLVRQVFSHGAFQPAAGVACDQGEIETGLAAAPRVLLALDNLADELDAASPTLADLHLAPMIAYFTTAPAAAEMLHKYPAIAAWWATIRKRESVTATWPPLPRSDPTAPTGETDERGAQK
ncbi:MAG: glutathione S-transferase family protein [Alphaproteobacteria bacterium]